MLSLFSQSISTFVTFVHPCPSIFSGRQTITTDFTVDASQGWSADYDTGRSSLQPLYNSTILPAAAVGRNHKYEYSPISKGGQSVSAAFVSQDGVPVAPAPHVRNPLFIDNRPVRLATADTKATAGFSQYEKVPSNSTNVDQEIDEGAKEVLLEIGDTMEETRM